MKSWPAPFVPAVPGHGDPLRLYDTQSRSVRPLDAGEVVRLYVCGITPYDATHLGHAATYVTFDLVGRALRGRPPRRVRPERHRRRRPAPRARGP